MKVTVLDGAHEDGTLVDDVLAMLLDDLGQKGWQVGALILRELDIRHCIGCFGCWVRTPGVCVIDDVGRDVARATIQSDLVVWLTPVTFGGYSSQLKKALDRTLGLISPFFTKIDGEVHHKPRYERYPRVLAVGVLPQADAESGRIFKTLVGRNAINFHAPAHVASVVWQDQDPGRIRQEIEAALAAVEVKG